MKTTRRIAVLLAALPVVGCGLVVEAGGPDAVVHRDGPDAFEGGFGDGGRGDTASREVGPDADVTSDPGDSDVVDARDAGDTDATALDAINADHPPSADGSDGGPLDAATAARPSCPDPAERGCTPMVRIQGQRFSMGVDVPDSPHFIDPGWEAPTQTDIRVNSFLLDATEVTVARLRRYVSAGQPAPAGGTEYPGGTLPWSGTVMSPADPNPQCNWSDTPGARELHPINCVEWETAQAFCIWDGGRLPTDAEWELAARYRQDPERATSYPWGNEDPSPACDRMQWNRCAGDDGASTRRVGSFPPSGGLWDLAGNVYEWCADQFVGYEDARCWGNLPRTNPLCEVGSDRLYRGGGFTNGSLLAAKMYLRPGGPVHRSYAVGFRCARSVPPGG